jgi:polyphosphate glucokinase
MRTLCIDVGASAIKGMILDDAGGALTERVRIKTPVLSNPENVGDVIADVARRLETMLVDPERPYDRVSCGFPGVIESGVVKTAPNLVEGWAEFDLARSIEFRLGRPTRVANDADVHGLGVIEERGVELVLTLGTGLGSALFSNGRAVPNLEFGHHPYGKGDETYEDRLGNAARKKIGNKRWSRRVHRAVAQLIPIFNPSRLYLGGGNVANLEAKGLPDVVKIVDNAAGIRGGVRLWETR